jgi:UDP-N-acetylglucosamine 2-epimerase (non-hydrolysing)
MKLSFIVGTRPEIIKLTSVILACPAKGMEAQLIHTGQHYDYQMSAVFFKELALPNPDLFLEVGSGSHGMQTGDALQRVERALLVQPPAVVVVVGDTNSTVAGALAAVKCGIPVAHVEAGVRSFDWTMPEEINRRLVDAISTLCFAPTQRGIDNLCYEGRSDSAYLAGDTLVETCRPMLEKAEKLSDVLGRIQQRPKEYALLTLHRSENVDSAERLAALVDCLESVGYPIVYPIHPRAQKMLERFGLLERLEQFAQIIPPQGYIDFLKLVNNARVILTDSGGVQQEASIVRVPCLTLRNNTEWLETIEAGHNRLIDLQSSCFSTAFREVLANPEAVLRQPTPFQPGAADRITETLQQLAERGSLCIPRSNFIMNGIPSPRRKSG